MSDSDERNQKSKPALWWRGVYHAVTDRLQQAGKVLSSSSRVDQLRDEIALLTSHSTDTIYRLRYDDMAYDYVSPSVIRLLGYTPEEFKRFNFRNLIKETRIVRDGMRSVESFAGLEKARNEREVSQWQADYLVRRKDGKEIWISDISYPWFDCDGNIIGSVGTLRDITDRVAAETQVQKELARIATTDSLTGLASRSYFFQRLDREIKRCRRSGASLSLLLIDIDRFKTINHEYGHAMGDQVIRRISEIVQGCLRETDLAGRVGGEEYGVVLPDTPIKGAYWVAERIRTEVARTNFMPDDLGTVGTTVSIGVADLSREEEMDATRLYKVADTRLYIAKHTGRNQVSMDELVVVH